MELFIVILKNAELVAEICKELAEEGVHGGTILDGTGMASVIEKMDDLPIFGMLKAILADDDEHEVVKIMLFVMKKENIEKAKEVIRNVVGLDEPNTGIMFSVPITFVEGLGA
ncbi:MAG: hypothetical protein ACI39Q_09970 [Wujia sp.]